MNLIRAAGFMDARLLGRDAVFSGVATDSRQAVAGKLFFALQGPNFDGHAYVNAAAAAGACAAVVSRPIETGLPLLQVADTRRALGMLASSWRQQHYPRIVALTGSNGKTTVKQMTAAILGQRAPTLATRGNLNNDIGLPLTLLELTDTHRFAVLEMGANHHGEIDYLSRLATPDIAIITNAGHAHLEGFGDLDGVASAKGEILNGLASNGVAVLNADDPYFEFWCQLAGKQRVVSFGLNPATDVFGVYQDGYLQVHYGDQHGRFPCPLPGEHNARNALAAAAAAMVAGCTLAEVEAGLSQNFSQAAGRLEFKAGHGGARLIDDSYNANPDSLLAALPVLVAAGGEPWLLLGNMAELGQHSASLHYQLGEHIRSAGIRRLFTLGELAAEASAGYGVGAQHFDSAEAAIEALQQHLHKDVCLLVKGSRSMRLERIVAQLLANASSEQRPVEH